MFHKILVAMDRSAIAQQIFDEALSLAKATGASLFLLHVMSAEVNVDFIQLQGSPSREICNLADTWQADLIVMGRRGRSGLSELFLGSVSNYVFHHAPYSVLTVQSPGSKKTQSLETNQAELVKP